jgi:RNA polymerase sigma-70 factor (ECF subfamily)
LPPPDPRTDEALVEAVNAGDSVAFEALYRRHRDWVVRLAIRFTGDRDLALDVLQETFAYLLSKVPHLSLTAKLTTFLYPVIRNLSIAARRKSARFAADEAALAAIPAPAGPEGVGHRADLAAALADLPEEQREVVLMRFLDDMPLDDIARALDIPPGTVKSRLHNALARLRDDPACRRLLDGG